MSTHVGGKRIRKTKPSNSKYFPRTSFCQFKRLGWWGGEGIRADAHPPLPWVLSAPSPSDAHTYIPAHTVARSPLLPLLRAASAAHCARRAHQLGDNLGSFDATIIPQHFRERTLNRTQERKQVLEWAKAGRNGTQVIIGLILYFQLVNVTLLDRGR